MRTDRFTLLAVLACTSAASTSFAAATLTPLGDLPGGEFRSAAFGVSGDGSTVVGESYVVVSGYALPQAFRWTATSGMVGLGYLGGNGTSVATGVSGDGSVVVGRSDSSPGYQAFRWTSSGGMVGLGDLPGGSFQSSASAVSGDGSAVVGSSSVPLGLQAFRWTSAGGMVSLGDLPGGGVSSSGVDISYDGSTVVGSSNKDVGYEAFRWTAGSGMVGLGYLPGGDTSSASGVSGDGSVVVGNSASASGGEGFCWTAEGGMVGLGKLPGHNTSIPLAVSGDGSVIVGLGQSASFLQEAFRWTTAGGMERLWDVLLANGVDPAADGWTRIAEARGISLDGSAIVGSGIRNGNTEAFLAVIPVGPEPGDADRNGTIDILDYFAIDRGRALHLSGWANGDFTGNGVIDADDYAVIDRAFLSQQAGPGAPGAAVPEPAALLPLAGVLVLRRASRRSGQKGPPRGLPLDMRWR